jgi:hypothetical protein
VVVLIFLIAVLGLIYYFRGQIFKILRAPQAQPPTRRYGVVSADAED